MMTSSTKTAAESTPETKAAHEPSAAMMLAASEESYRLALEPKTFGETMLACELLAQAGHFDR